MSSELAIAQAERAKGFAVFMCPAPRPDRVTCRMQVIMLRCSHTCKMQVTKESVVTAITLPPPAESQQSGRGGIRLAVVITLTFWLLLVVSLGLAGAFVGAPGTP